MKPRNLTLLESLNKDEQSCSTALYAPGPYWEPKAKKINLELQQKGLENFRGYNSGVGTSYCDNIIIDLWNEEVSRIRNALRFIVYKIPILNRVGELIQRTQTMLIDMHKEKIKILECFFKDNKFVKELLEKFRAEDSTSFGCIDCIEIDSKIYSIHYLELLNTLSFISEKIDFTKIRSMFEIGGGFGANVHLMLQNYKNLKKVIYLDIAPNLFVGTEYLRSIYGDCVHDYLETKCLDTIQFSANDDLEIFCIAPWQIEKLDVFIDYFYNAHSFVEMPEKVVKNYAYHLEKLLNPEGKIALVSYDNFSENNTLVPTNLMGYFKSIFQSYEYPHLFNPYRKSFYFISAGKREDLQKA